MLPASWVMAFSICPKSWYMTAPSVLSIRRTLLLEKQCSRLLTNLLHPYSRMAQPQCVWPPMSGNLRRPILDLNMWKSISAPYSLSMAFVCWVVPIVILGTLIAPIGCVTPVSKCVSLLRRTVLPFSPLKPRRSIFRVLLPLVQTSSVPLEPASKGSPLLRVSVILGDSTELTQGPASSALLPLTSKEPLRPTSKELLEQASKGYQQPASKKHLLPASKEPLQPTFKGLLRPTLEPTSKLLEPPFWESQGRRVLQIPGLSSYAILDPSK